LTQKADAEQLTTNDNLRMPWTRVDGAANTAPLSPSALFHLLAAGPTVLIMDCRSVLSTGLLPRTRVLRIRAKETLTEALDRVIKA